MCVVRVVQIIAIFISVGCLLCKLALAEATDASWNMGLYGQSMDDSISQSKIVGAEANLKLQHNFSNSFKANIESQLKLESGSSQALFTDEFRPRQQILLNEGSVTWLALPEFSLKAGAINQNFHNNPLLIDGDTFPAFLENISIGKGAFSLSLIAQQAIPTSQSFSAKTVGIEPTPSVFTEKFYLNTTLQNYFFDANIGHFAFNQLTHGVAQDSRFYGNTVIGLGPQGAQFLYGYNGFDGGGDLGIKFSNALKMKLGAQVLYNRLAPKGQDSGRLVFTELTYTNTSIEIAPKLTLYHNEADASPGFYDSKEFAHNNRDATGIGLRLGFIKQNLDLSSEYINSKLIQDDPLQADSKYFLIKIGTRYAKI